MYIYKQIKNAIRICVAVLPRRITYKLSASTTSSSNACHHITANILSVANIYLHIYTSRDAVNVNKLAYTKYTKIYKQNSQPYIYK